MNKPPDPGGSVSSSRVLCSSPLLQSIGFLSSWPDFSKFLLPHLVGRLISHPVAPIFKICAALVLCPPACLFLVDPHILGLSRHWRCSILLHQCFNCTSQVSSLSLLYFVSLFPVAIVGLVLLFGRFHFRVWVARFSTLGFNRAPIVLILSLIYAYAWLAWQSTFNLCWLAFVLLACCRTLCRLWFSSVLTSFSFNSSSYYVLRSLPPN